MAVVRKQDGSVVCERCLVADSAWLRMKGLLGRASLADDAGILLRPASSVHMFFMRFAIDAVFLDRELRVVKVAATLRPWRMAGAMRSRAVLELPAGACERRGIREGDQLSLE